MLDLDIRAFFDRIDHAWMIKFVEHRIGDRKVVRLIQKWLKAGVMEQGRWFEAEEGTPQGAVIRVYCYAELRSLESTHSDSQMIL